MKPTALLPLLFLAVRASAQYTDVDEETVNEVFEWGQKTFGGAPACIDTCLAYSNPSAAADDIVPPCAITDQDAEDAEMESYQNSVVCLCADRIWQARQLECVLKTCKDKDAQTGFDYALASQYAVCAIYSGSRWPRPPVMLEELCLADDVPKGVTVPQEMDIFDDAPKLLSEYEYAESWPSQTATTWAPNGTPIPETRKPLECEAKSGNDNDKPASNDDDAAETSATKTDSAPKETGTGAAGEQVEEDTGAAAGGIKVSALVIAAAGLVGGLVVVL